MIDISFLDPPNVLKTRSGLEFIDYQGKAFYLELVNFIKTVYDPETYSLNWSIENRKKLADLIATYTNIRVLPRVGGVLEFSILAGFVSPNSVLNAQGCDEQIKKEYSNIGEFFKEFKRNDLVGWCDLKTGKVEGDFKNVAFELSVASQMPVPEKLLGKYSKIVNIEEVVASSIIHELGHAFFSLYFLASSTLENIYFIKASAMINAATEKTAKIKIVNDLKKEIGIDVSQEVSKTGKLTVVGFSKGIGERNKNRALSLGTTQITSEILADAYCIRMGGSVANNATMAGLAKAYQDLNRISFAWLGIFTVLQLLGAPAIIGTSLLLLRGAHYLHGSRLELFSTTHEPFYKRLKTNLRETIDILRKERNAGNAKVVKMLTEEAMLAEKMIEESKPFLEGSYLKDLIGLIYKGKDFKRYELETDTAELIYNPISIYTTFDNKPE